MYSASHSKTWATNSLNAAVWPGGCHFVARFAFRRPTFFWKETLLKGCLPLVGRKQKIFQFTQMNVKRSPLLCSNHAWATSGKDSYSCIKEIVQQQWAEMLVAMSICKNIHCKLPVLKDLWGGTPKPRTQRWFLKTCLISHPYWNGMEIQYRKCSLSATCHITCTEVGALMSQWTEISTSSSSVGCSVWRFPLWTWLQKEGFPPCVIR